MVRSISAASSVSSVVWSAFRAGSLAGVQVRASSRASSRVVLVAWFRCPRRAGVFATRWAKRLGLSVVVRPRRGLWAVSVPVVGCVPFMGPYAWPVVGGVRGVPSVAMAASGALL